jgi:hypothetical protein
MIDAFSDDAVKLIIRVSDDAPMRWLTERLGPVVYEGISPWWSTGLSGMYGGGRIIKGRHIFRIGCPNVAMEFKLRFA